jgi:hypothetical protein
MQTLLEMVAVGEHSVCQGGRRRAKWLLWTLQSYCGGGGLSLATLFPQNNCCPPTCYALGRCDILHGVVK